MTGQASPGLTLTPNRNVVARAGIGGGLWGANGGDITPVGGGVTGQKGWDERVAPAQSTCQTAANYEQSPVPVTATGAALSVLTQQSAAQLSGAAFDDALLSGGSNQG